MSRLTAIGKRKPNKTVLLVTNGQITEKSYLNEIKRRANPKGVRVTVLFENGDPLSVLKKLTSPYGDTSAYDEIWIVVDEDSIDRTSFVAKCRSQATKRQKWFAIVSRPCFEVWLIAHYEQVRNYSTPADAQNHFASLVPKGTPKKVIPSDFPYDSFAAASGRCQLVNSAKSVLNALPSAPGTAMPHLVEAMHR